MQRMDALQQGGMVAALRQVGHRPPQVMLGPHAADPMAFDEDDLALALHRDDDPVQHQACDRLAVSRRGGGSRPQRRDI